MTCCNGRDPACAIHGVSASNARQNEFYRRATEREDSPTILFPICECCSRAITDAAQLVIEESEAETVYLHASCVAMDRV